MSSSGTREAAGWRGRRPGAAGLFAQAAGADGASATALQPPPHLLTTLPAPAGGRTARPPPRRGPRGRAGSTLGSTRRVAGTTSEDLRSEGYTDRGRGTYSSWPRRATSRLSFCARPKRLSSARKPPSSLRPSSVGASSSAWRRTRSPLPGWPQPPAAARKSAEPRASPERRSRASCRRRSTPRFQPAGARSHFGGRRLPLL